MTATNPYGLQVAPYIIAFQRGRVKEILTNFTSKGLDVQKTATRIPKRLSQQAKFIEIKDQYRAFWFEKNSTIFRPIDSLGVSRYTFRGHVKKKLCGGRIEQIVYEVIKNAVKIVSKVLVYTSL